jgi:hypothetical protein
VNGGVGDRRGRYVSIVDDFMEVERQRIELKAKHRFSAFEGSQQIEMK